MTVELLADLQAGLLDDRTAARLRQRARTEPQVAAQLAALDRVRREVSELGTDAESAPDVPAELAHDIGVALRSALPPDHATTSRFRHLAAAAGIAAVLVAGVVGTVTLLHGAPNPSAPVDTTPQALPLSRDQLGTLLHQRADLGELTDPRRRASCLSGLGYPVTTAVLGGERTELGGGPAVLMLLPGDTAGRVDVVVVGRQCSAADTALVLSSVVDVP